MSQGATDGDPGAPVLAPALARSSERARERALAGAILAAAALALWLWPERLPGLHVDEAWSFFRAREIIAGRRPLDGMNYYTGALHHYLLAAAVALLGLHVWVLKLLAGAANLAMLAGYMCFVRRLHPDRDTWLWVGALTMSSATFIIYGRLGIELCVLTPLLLVGGALLVQAGAGAARRRSWALSFLGGACFGLAVYNHMAAAALVAGLALGYAVALSPRAWLAPRHLAAVLGLLAGLTPRLVQLARIPAHRPGPGARLLKNLAQKLTADLPTLPEALRGMLDGDLLYQRVAGPPLLWVAPYFSGALALLALAHLLRRPRALPRRQDLAWLVAIGSSAALMALIADHLALRYYSVPALVMPYVLARLAGSAAHASEPRWLRHLGRAALPAVLLLQALYVGVNYFHAHLSSGGKIHVFPLGGHVMESSNGFVRTDRLYARLVALGVPYLVADNLIRWPLELYGLGSEPFRASATPDDARWRVPRDAPTALVYYNGPNPLGGLKLEDRRGVETLTFNGRRFTLEPELDPNFLVFIHRPAR